MQSALYYAIAIRQFVSHMGGSVKTAEVRIVLFSLQSSPEFCGISFI